LENFTTCEEIKYNTPATKSIAINKAIEMAITLLMFLEFRKFTNGFNKMEIINAKAIGIIIFRRTNKTYTKRMIPKRMTVERRKNGYFFCIKNILRL
jgi:hypothetical protein